MSLRILHTSDWHLGKKLYREERLAEQELFLDWLFQVIKEEQIDLLIIAGDIFDVYMPPANALRVFYDFLNRVGQLKRVGVFVIAGNHDSGKFIEAPNGIYPNNVTVFGSLAKNPLDHTVLVPLGKSGKVISLTFLPYFRSFELYNWALAADSQAESEGENNLLKQLDGFLGHAQKSNENIVCRVLVAHHLFGNFEFAGSEQVLYLSGLTSIPIEVLAQKFDAVLLGHIHKKQVIKKEDPFIVYAGSPLPLRFSEKNRKYINIVDVATDNGKANYQFKEIPLFRALYSCQLTEENWEREIISLQEKLESSGASVLKPFFEVVLKLKTVRSDLVDTIRTRLNDGGIYPLSFDCIFRDESPHANAHERSVSLHLPNTMELFKQFYKEKYPQMAEVDKTLENDFLQILQLSSRKTNSNQDGLSFEDFH